MRRVWLPLDLQLGVWVFAPDAADVPWGAPKDLVSCARLDIDQAQHDQIPRIKEVVRGCFGVSRRSSLLASTIFVRVECDRGTPTECNRVSFCLLPSTLSETPDKQTNKQQQEETG